MGLWARVVAFGRVRALAIGVVGVALLGVVSGGQAAEPPIVPPALPTSCEVEFSAGCLETRADMASVSADPLGIAVGDTVTVSVTHVTPCPSQTTEEELAGFPNQRCTTTLWGSSAGFVDNLTSGTVTATRLGTCDGSTPTCSYRVDAVTFPSAPGNRDPLPAWVTFPLDLNVVRYDGSRPPGSRIVFGERVRVDAPVWVVRPATTGSIEVVKETVPANDPQSFAFTGLGDFSLDTDAGSALPDRRTFIGLEPGNHTVSESPTPGWQLAALTCNDQTGSTTTQLATATAMIDLAAGETVTCTFRNRKATTGLVVNSTADGTDAAAGDGSCSTGGTIARNGQAEAECTLRAAVVEANAQPGPNTITFDIPQASHDIAVRSSLPVGGETTIDGTTQDGVRVMGDGANAVVGFDLSGARNVLKGLDVFGFEIAVDIRGEDHTVTRSTIHGRVGIRTTGARTTIGGSTGAGTCDQDCNILQGGTAIRVAAGATSTRIAGNFIGMTDFGTATTPMSSRGVVVDAGSSATTIGGMTAGERNVIAADTAVELHAPTRVVGNYIGVGPEGEPLQNSNFVAVQPQVGIDGRDTRDLVIGATAAPGEAPGNLIGPAETAGIRLRNVEVAVIAGTLVGRRDADAVVDSSDRGYGICIASSERVNIGTPSSGNLVSGNDGNGIEVTRSALVTIEGNRIGTDAAGTAAIGNDSGIVIRGGRELQVSRNVLSGNRENGISIGLAEALEFDKCAQASLGDADEMPGPVSIAGNTVGTDAAGAAALGNGRYGIFASASLVTNPFGTGTPEFHVTDNLISGNRSGGAWISVGGRPFESAPTSTFAGNLVGTDRSGTRAIPNVSGLAGAIVIQSDSWLVGGARTTTNCQSPCNVISGNQTSSGLELYGSGIVVTGNAVGVARDGVTPLPNAGAGIDGRNDDFSPPPVIGGVQPSEWNTIANNGRSGIEISGIGGVTVRGNRLVSNGGLGIDLAGDGVTENDSALDPDEGPNHLLNHPRIDSVRLRDGTLQVTGYAPTPLDPLAGNVVDLYANRACDPSGFGEGEFLLASGSVGPLSEGFFQFDLPLDARLGFTAISATLTVGGSTSELSRCVTIADESGSTLTAAAPRGATRLEIGSSAGLVGKVVTLGTGPTAEKNYGDRAGSLILLRPTRFAHAKGEQVAAADDTLFVSVDKAVITRSSKLPDVAVLSGRLRAVQGRGVACGEDVTLTLDGSTVAQKLPGTRFARQSGNRCVFVAKTENGIGRLELDLGKGTWSAQVVRRDLERLTSPVEVGLRIGDDAGTESLVFRMVGPVWTYTR